LVLAGLLLVKAGVAIGAVLGLDSGQVGPLRGLLQVSPEVRQLLASAVLLNLLAVILAVLLVVSAAGLVLLRRDAWVLTMVLTGLLVAGDIVGFVNGTVDYVWMALNIVTVFYLNQVDVRAAVGVSTAPLVAVGPPT
jgi:hypothetical protein